MFSRFASKEDLQTLRKIAVLVRDWKRKLGTDEQYLLKGLAYEVEGGARLSVTFYRLYDLQRDRVFRSMRWNDAERFRRAWETHEDLFNAYYYPKAYADQKLLEEVAALREEVNVLNEKVSGTAGSERVQDVSM